jgi:acetoin utilization deacetylase AcuC-like enzyme
MLLYPYTGDFSETGSGEGAGYTLNIPLPRETDDNDLFYVYRAVLGPLLAAYRPQLILVSAGFDAHREDPMGRLNLSAAAFGRLAALVISLARCENAPPILFSLEGGYDPGALADCVREVLKVLTAECLAPDDAPNVTRLGEQLVAKARQIHAAFSVWT